MPHDELIAKLAELYGHISDRENLISMLVHVLDWCEENGEYDADLLTKAHIRKLDAETVTT